MSEKTATDWKEIALALGQRVNFAMQHLKPRSGSGMMLDTEKGTLRSWRGYMSDGLEMIPGVKVDPEAVKALDFPAKERAKFFAERRKAKGAA